MNDPVKIVKSADRALEILELLADRPDGLSLSELCEDLSIPLSSMHNLVGTLAHRGYIVREEPSLLYRLGPKMLQLAGKFWAGQDLVSLSTPFMYKLRDEVEETTSLSVLQDDLVVFVHKVPANGIVQVVNPVGTRLPAHATGSGKVMLAYLSREELYDRYPHEELEQLTPETITSRSALLEALEQVRVTGYSEDRQESLPGVYAVAACIRDALGKPVAALSIVAPAFRVEMKDHERWPRLVMESVAAISNLLGFEENE